MKIAALNRPASSVMRDGHIGVRIGNFRFAEINLEIEIGLGS